MKLALEALAAPEQVQVHAHFAGRQLVGPHLRQVRPVEHAVLEDLPVGASGGAGWDGEEAREEEEAGGTDAGEMGIHLGVG